MIVALREHPAKFPVYLLDRITMYVRAERRRLGRPVAVLDPFAGVGRIHDLPARLADTVGVELEPEWAACRAGTIVGDARHLPVGWECRFDAVITSPCYGNRMADSHEARDACRQCGGTGVLLDEDGCGDAPWACANCGVACCCGRLAMALRDHNLSCPRCRWLRCSACGGRGVSRRYSYRHVLRRPLTEGSAAGLAWGHDYRQLHVEVWRETHRVLKPGGLIVVNVKNHIRDGKEQKVVEWHVEALGHVGFHVKQVVSVPARGLRHGANRGERVDNEQLIVGRA